MRPRIYRIGPGPAPRKPVARPLHIHASCSDIPFLGLLRRAEMPDHAWCMRYEDESAVWITSRAKPGFRAEGDASYTRRAGAHPALDRLRHGSVASESAFHIHRGEP
jgi:hypothetical protein